MKLSIAILFLFTGIGCATAPKEVPQKAVWDLDSIRSNPEKMKKAQADHDECVDFGFKTAAARRVYHRANKDFLYNECMHVRGYKSIMVPDVPDQKNAGN